MAKVEEYREQMEAEPGSKQIVLFIDDDLANLKILDRIIQKFDGLETKYIHPQALQTIPRKDLIRVSLVMVDQFVERPDQITPTSKFLESLTSINPKTGIVEISYVPQPLIYKNSIGVLDTFLLCNKIKNEMQDWPKTALGFIQKIKWLSNRAFREAEVVDHMNDDDKVFLESYRTLLESFERLTNDNDYPKLLTLLNTTAGQFEGSFYSANKLTFRKVFLHSAWQIIGHIIFGHDEDSYSMSLQRLNELITDKISRWKRG